MNLEPAGTNPAHLLKLEPRKRMAEQGTVGSGRGEGGVVKAAHRRVADELASERRERAAELQKKSGLQSGVVSGA